jgi:hypothetical protein
VPSSRSFADRDASGPGFRQTLPRFQWVRRRCFPSCQNCSIKRTHWAHPFCSQASSRDAGIAVGVIRGCDVILLFATPESSRRQALMHSHWPAADARAERAGADLWILTPTVVWFLGGVQEFFGNHGGALSLPHAGEPPLFLLSITGCGMVRCLQWTDNSYSEGYVMPAPRLRRRRPQPYSVKTPHRPDSLYTQRAPACKRFLYSPG